MEGPYGTLSFPGIQSIANKLVLIVPRLVAVSINSISSGACGGHSPSQDTRLNDLPNGGWKLLNVEIISPCNLIGS